MHHVEPNLLLQYRVRTCCCSAVCETLLSLSASVPPPRTHHRCPQCCDRPECPPPLSQCPAQSHPSTHMRPGLPAMWPEPEPEPSPLPPSLQRPHQQQRQRRLGLRGLPLELSVADRHRHRRPAKAWAVGRAHCSALQVRSGSWAVAAAVPRRSQVPARSSSRLSVSRSRSSGRALRRLRRRPRRHAAAPAPMWVGLRLQDRASRTSRGPRRKCRRGPRRTRRPALPSRRGWRRRGSRSCRQGLRVWQGLQRRRLTCMLWRAAALVGPRARDRRRRLAVMMTRRRTWQPVPAPTPSSRRPRCRRCIKPRLPRGWQPLRLPPLPPPQQHPPAAVRQRRPRRRRLLLQCRCRLWAPPSGGRTPTRPSASWGWWTHRCARVGLERADVDA